jgi:hypothetical protein
MRIYNNYDGYMYTVHKLSLGELLFEGILYHLDNEQESRALLDILVNKGYLLKYIQTNQNQIEYEYRFTTKLLPKEWIDERMFERVYQWKATILNIKYCIENNVIENSM